MKFKPSRRDGLPRIGCISQIDNYPDVNFTTPNCLLYTKFGAVPFLTNDIVKQIYGLPNLTFASLNFLRERFKVFRKFGKGLAQYSGLGVFFTFLILKPPRFLSFFFKMTLLKQP